MSTERLSNLYQTRILELNTHPFHYEKRVDAQYIIEAYNPLCGDKFKIFLDIDNNCIQNAAFFGHGCAISKAASSVLIQQIFQKRIEEALTIIKSYFLMLNTEGVMAQDIDNDLLAFSTVKQFPERLSCATLSWQAVEDFLKEYKG